MNTNDIRINLPASKSMSNRWLMINHVIGSHFRIGKLSTSGDTRLLRQLLAQLDESLGKENNGSDLYYCNNAGSVARFMMPLLAITPGHHVLSGDERLRQRPMAPIIDALRQMGLRVECTENEGVCAVCKWRYAFNHNIIIIQFFKGSNYAVKTCCFLINIASNCFFCGCFATTNQTYCNKNRNN